MHAAPPAELQLDPAAPSTSFASVVVRRRAVMSTQAVAAANELLGTKTPTEIIEWASAQFGSRLAMTASFADTTLIDLATKVDPDIEVIFLDTGFHFAETLNTVHRAMERYELNLTVLRPDADAADLWAAGTDGCCGARKVAPLEEYLPQHADGWLSGLRRADDPGRANAPIVSIDKRGLVKVNPMANMSNEEHDSYIETNDVLVNTLQLDGYGSIGCWPCTEPAADRSGRWSGSGKTECGLHL